jgi:hypothetical protein
MHPCHGAHPVKPIKSTQDDHSAWDKLNNITEHTIQLNGKGYMSVILKGIKTSIIVQCAHP